MQERDMHRHRQGDNGCGGRGAIAGWTVWEAYGIVTGIDTSHTAAAATTAKGECAGMDDAACIGAFSRGAELHFPPAVNAMRRL